MVGVKLKLWLTVMAAVLTLLGLAPAGASSANISHSYKSSGAIAAGSLVSLDPARASYIVAANTGNARHLLGVTVASGDSLLAVDETGGDAQVATSGTVSALVMDL